jgi:hypothetical protein
MKVRVRAALTTLAEGMLKGLSLLKSFSELLSPPNEVLEQKHKSTSRSRLGDWFGQI